MPKERYAPWKELPSIRAYPWDKQTARKLLDEVGLLRAELDTCRRSIDLQRRCHPESILELQERRKRAKERGHDDDIPLAAGSAP